MNGKFIAIDGTDGSGKATQTELLVKKLKEEGHEVEVADFPQYGERSAVLVEDYLNGKFGSAKEVSPYQASVFYAVDRYAASFKIRRWLKEGKIVVANRYTSANMGHQTGKIKEKEERDMFLDWLDNFEFGIFNIPRPDMTLLLFVPPEINKELVEEKGTRKYQKEGEVHDIHTKDQEHMKDASNAYKYVAEKYYWPIINCTENEKLKTREEIHSLIWEKVKEIL
ncbi:dTMP kinase [Bacteroidota bacterium]